MKYTLELKIEADNMARAMGKAWDLVGGTPGIEYRISADGGGSLWRRIYEAAVWAYEDHKSRVWRRWQIWRMNRRAKRAN